MAKIALGLSTLLVLLATTRAYSQGFVYTLSSPNAEEGGAFGKSISMAGDANSDGLSDILVGASHESPGSSPSFAGRAYLFSGSTGEVLHTFASPNEQTDSRFGTGVAMAGDVNNDGCCDILIGARWESHEATKAGRAYVFSGQTGELLHTLVSPEPEPYGSFGDAVAGAGDVNNDGYDDLLVGAAWLNPWSGPEGEGRAYLFSGSDGALLHTFVSPNDPNGFLGNAVSGLGDVNDDGNLDVLVGAWREDPGSSPFDAGRAYVFSGLTGDVLHELASPNEESNGWFGAAVAGLGDLDDDTVPDILIGAPREDPAGSPRDAGRAYLFSGRTAALLMTLTSPDESYSGELGWNGSGLPDTNEDGYPEMVVSAFEDGPNGTLQAGRVHVFSGSTGTALFSVDSPNPTTTGGFGAVVCGAGDVNGDGVHDLAIGAVFENFNGIQDAGRAYVIDLTVTSVTDEPHVMPKQLRVFGPFPNPTEGTISLTIHYMNRDHQPARLRLVDIAARCVADVATDLGATDPWNTLHWRAPAHLRSGTYILRLDVSGQAEQMPLVIQR